MVRFSRALIVIGLGSISTGCLIGPPDPIEEQQQVPPRVLMQTAEPTPFAYVRMSPDGPPQTFSVDFYSEDLGEKIVGKLYLNLDTENEEFITSAETGPGSLSDPAARTMQITVDPNSFKRIENGCYVMTMTLTFESNYGNVGFPKPTKSELTAYVTWWVAYGTAPESLPLSECPQPNPDL